MWTVVYVSQSKETSEKLVDVLCFMRNKCWCCDYNPFHFFLLLDVFLVSCFSSEAVSYEC